MLGITNLELDEPKQAAPAEAQQGLAIKATISQDTRDVQASPGDVLLPDA